MISFKKSSLSDLSLFLNQFIEKVYIKDVFFEKETKIKRQDPRLS